MSEDEYREIKTAAERRRVNVSEWVRSVLRDARDRDARGTPVTARESSPPYGERGATLTRRLRIEVEVNEDLLEAVRERYHLSNPRAAIEYALARAAVRPMSRQEALAMEGAGWDGDLGALRSGDPGETW